MAEIQLNHVYKKFEDGVTAVKNFTLDIHDRDFVVFVGPPDAENHNAAHDRRTGEDF